MWPASGLRTLNARSAYGHNHRLGNDRKGRRMRALGAIALLMGLTCLGPFLSGGGVIWLVPVAAGIFAFVFALRIARAMDYPNKPGQGKCGVCLKNRIAVFSGYKDRNGVPVYINKCPQGHVCPDRCWGTVFPYASCTDYCTKCGCMWDPT